MNQFTKIFKFELKNYLSNKVFIGVTLFFAIIIIIVMFFPRMTSMFISEENSSDSDYYDYNSDSTDSGNSEIDEDGLVVFNRGKEKMLVLCDEILSDDVISAFSREFWQYEVEYSDKDISIVESMIKSGEVDCAFKINNLTDFTYYVGNLSMYDSNYSTATEILKNVYQETVLKDKGLSQDSIHDILNVFITGDTVTLGKDQIINYFYTYIMIFALYMVILLYGQMVATNVATEKSSRAMELLITSAKPTNLLFGKIFASCLAGLIQIAVIFGTAFLCFNLNKEYWDEFGIISAIFDIPFELIIYMIVFFILGFLVYAFMYGAVGSTASKLEDINTSVMPITFLFIFGFMVVVFSLTSANVDSLFMRICSYIPFTSPMAMFTRIAMSTVPLYEIVICIAILIGSIVCIGYISAKIYRVGVLLYGTPPKPSEIMKAIKH